MGVNHTLAAAARQFSSKIARQVSNRSTTRSEHAEPAGMVLTDAEIAAATRRRRERSEFGDDATYFEFLINRAIADPGNSPAESS